MTEEERAFYRKAAEEGTMPDAQNPIFVFSSTHKDLLLKIVKGEFNLIELAGQELRDRGFDISGNWVGFYRSEGKENPAFKQKAKFKHGKGL